MENENTDRPKTRKSRISPEAEEKLANGLREAERIVRQRRADPYTWSRLSEWLELETWAVRQGLALLADLEPRETDIDWDGFYNGAGVFVEEPVVKNAGLLSESDWFSIIPTELPVRKLPISESGRSEALAEIEAKRKKLGAAESRLRRLKRLWDSGQRSGDRFPIMEFVTWAERKKIEIPWKAWAVQHGFLKTRSDAKGTESPEERRARLIKRRAELKATGIRNWTQKLAEEEGVGASRIRQLIGKSADSAAVSDLGRPSWPSIGKRAR